MTKARSGLSKPMPSADVATTTFTSLASSSLLELLAALATSPV